MPQTPKSIQRKDSFLGNSSEDDMSFLVVKRSRSARTEDEQDGDIILGDQQIVFYEPRKQKEKQKAEEKALQAERVLPTKKGKKKKGKKRETEVAQKDDEEDKMKALLGLIRSFSQPNLKTPKLKDLRLKIEATEEKEVIEEKKPPVIKTPKASTPSSLNTIKKIEKVETTASKGPKETKEKDVKVTKHIETDTAKKTFKGKTIGSSSSEANVEEKIISKSQKTMQPPKKERLSVTEKEEVIPQGNDINLTNIATKDKEAHVAGSEKINEQNEEKEGENEELKEEGLQSIEDKEDKMFRWCSICDLIVSDDFKLFLK